MLAAPPPPFFCLQPGDWSKIYRDGGDVQSTTAIYRGTTARVLADEVQYRTGPLEVDVKQITSASIHVITEGGSQTVFVHFYVSDCDTLLRIELSMGMYLAIMADVGIPI